MFAGEHFDKSSELHSWTVVNVEGKWELVDPLLGAGERESGDQDPSLLQLNIDDHFFLTDPEEFLYSHFPYERGGAECSRWQLLPRPASLHQFNAAPLLSSEFFSLGCSLASAVVSPQPALDHCSITLLAREPLSYKCQLSACSDQTDRLLAGMHISHLDNFCMSQLAAEDRGRASFTVAAPALGRYCLKIFGAPEYEISTEYGATYNFLASFLLQFDRVISKVRPWPVSTLPYGLTAAYHELGVRMVIDSPDHWEESRLVMVGGSKAMFKFIHDEGPVMSAVHMFDYLVSSTPNEHIFYRVKGERVDRGVG